jgi:hypothetical protein
VLIAGATSCLFPTVRTDRRPIDPPVIVQVFGSWNLSSFVSATLVKEDSDETVWFLDVSSTQYLAGGSSDTYIRLRMGRRAVHRARSSLTCIM